MHGGGPAEVRRLLTGRPRPATYCTYSRAHAQRSARKAHRPLDPPNKHTGGGGTPSALHCISLELFCLYLYLFFTMTTVLSDPPAGLI
jgi:hypothetical protein